MKQRVLITTAAALVALALPAGATAKSADRDHDRMPDKWEKHFGLNTHKNDARKDRDRDGLRNLAEFRAGTNPRKDDTDNDGVGDDQENAGTIATFDQATGTLTITLFGGGTLTGKVDATTELKCDDESEHGATSHQRHGADDPAGDGSRGDNSGPGNTGTTTQQDNSGPGNASDDNPATHDQGDDNPGAPGQGDDDDDDQPGAQQPACDASLLTAGRTVKEAKLNQGDDGPAGAFHEIELVR